MYFAGDSKLFDGIREIAERLRPDVAILPVDGTRLRGQPLHVMRPEDAVVAAKTLGARHLVPSHAEAYFSDPLAGNVIATNVASASEKFAALARAALPAVAVSVPLPGELVPLP